MNCLWDAYLKILPLHIRGDVDKLGREKLQELRLRIGQPSQLKFLDTSIWLKDSIDADDLAFVIQTASRYSPWASDTLGSGYLTAPGGHRIGICGDAVMQEDRMIGIRKPSSLCIRVARDIMHPKELLCGLKGSILIIGAPGKGKTTLLRNLVRCRSQDKHRAIAVVDERQEIFPHWNGKPVFQCGPCTDILSGCGKAQGIECALRTMGPSCIAVDEVTSPEDCLALIHAAWCGVDLIATAHASTKEDLYRRKVYRSLIDSGLFDTLLIMTPQQGWNVERMNK